MDTMKIAQALEDCLRSVAKTMEDRRHEKPPRRIGNGEWTHEILKSLYKLARSGSVGEEIYACPTFDEIWTDGEWLYDMIWYRNTDGFVEDAQLGLHRSLKDVVMVLESEWSHSAWEIQYDFEKLLVAKAPLKVVIIDDVDKQIVERVIVDGVKTFQGGYAADEVYLIAQYSNAKRNFEFTVFEPQKGF